VRFLGPVGAVGPDVVRGLTVKVRVPRRMERTLPSMSKTLTPAGCRECTPLRCLDFPAFAGSLAAIARIAAAAKVKKVTRIIALTPPIPAAGGVEPLRL
jgi:hypothetical protein